jgi:hypothetical protein
MKRCDYCGGNAESGCGAVESEAGRYVHYSKIECAEVLKLQVHDAKDCIQDLRDLLAEQPKESSRPFILGARRRLRAFDERWTEKRMPPVQITEGDIKNLEQRSKGLPDPVTSGDEDL